MSGTVKILKIKVFNFPKVRFKGRIKLAVYFFYKILVGDFLNLEIGLFFVKRQ